MEPLNVPEERRLQEKAEDDKNQQLSFVYQDFHIDSPPPSPSQESSMETCSEDPNRNNTTANKWHGYDDREYCKKHNISLVYIDHCLETFHGFRNLPTEVRCMIWELLLPGQRFFRTQAIGWPGNDGQDCRRPRDEALDTARLILPLGPLPRHLHPPVLAAICKESRQVLQRHAKLVFSTASTAEAPGAPGMWWLPETDILAFSGIWDALPIKEVGRLRDLQGLEHVRHLFTDYEYAFTVNFDVGMWPAYRPDDTQQHNDIQMIRLSYPEILDQYYLRTSSDMFDPDDRSFKDWPFLYPEFFPGMRTLSMHRNLNGEEPCREDDNYACSFINSCDEGPLCADTVTYHLNCETAVIEDLLYTKEYRPAEGQWWPDEIDLWPVKLYFYGNTRPGPILAIREGCTRTAEQVEWFSWPR